MPSRYIPAGIQAEFEPGSRGRVLRNLLGITRVGDIGEAESQTLLLTQVQAMQAIHRCGGSHVLGRGARRADFDSPVPRG